MNDKDSRIFPKVLQNPLSVVPDINKILFNVFSVIKIFSLHVEVNLSVTYDINYTFVVKCNKLVFYIINARCRKNCGFGTFLLFREDISLPQA